MAKHKHHRTVAIYYKISRTTMFGGWGEGVCSLFWGCVFFVCCFVDFFFFLIEKINANIKEADRKLEKGRENSIAIKRITLYKKKGTEKCEKHINRNYIMQIVCYSCFIHQLGKHSRCQKASTILLIFIRQKVK